MALPDLPMTRALVSELHVLDHTDSTNDDAKALALDGAPDFTLVVTDDQRKGRGRLGREWIASPGKTIAVSILIRSTELFTNLDRLGWIPLIAGLAMTRAVRAALGSAGKESVWLKWPNDVLISGQKVSGILTEMLTDDRAVVIGSGLNLGLSQEELPTPTATSLSLIAGHVIDVDEVLVGYLGGLQERVAQFVEHRGDPAAAGLLDEANALCVTLGQSVRVELSGERELLGTATDIDVTGRLVVRDNSGRSHAVAAGEVTHLRLAAGRADDDDR